MFPNCFEITVAQARQGFTLEQLAYEADMELTQLHRVLNGQHDPGITTLQRIAKALGSSLGELFNGL